MIETTCVQLFKTLTKNELRDLGNYLCNTYQKKGSVYSLYDFLRTCSPKFATAKLERKHIEKKLFSEKADPERTLYDAASKLIAQLKDFITIQELKKNEVHKNFLYLEALKSRKLVAHFFRESEILQENWEDEHIPGIEHFHNQFKLKILNYSHPNFSNQKLNKKLKLENVLDLIDIHYAAIKMYYTLINEINNQSRINEKYSVKKLLKDFENSISINNSKTAILYKFLETYNSNIYKDIISLKSNFFNSHYLFTQSEKHDLVEILKYLFYSKRHKYDVNKDLFEIVQFSLEENLLLEDGYLTNQSFANCILIAKANGATNWIEQFIENNKFLLNENDKKNNIKFGNIVICIMKQQFEEALTKLSLINLRIPIRVAQLKSYNLQCLYELSYEDTFKSNTSAFNQYLLNHKDDLIQNNNYLMFKEYCKFIKKMQLIKTDINIDKKNKYNRYKKLLKEIDESLVIPFDVAWLKAKINSYL